MIQSLLVLALVGMLSVGLTSCGANNRNNGMQPGVNDNTVTENGTYPNGTTGNQNGSMNGTGEVGDINNDAVGNADANTNNNANTQSKTANKRTSALRRSAYDYLNDGRYVAGTNGNVTGGRNTLGTDLTQGARDLIRGAGNVVGDVGRGVGNAARDVGNATRNTVRDLTR